MDTTRRHVVQQAEIRDDITLTGSVRTCHVRSV